MSTYEFTKDIAPLLLLLMGPLVGVILWIIKFK
jgi:hypothetical protein